MLQLLVLFAISALALWFFEKNVNNVLSLQFSKKKLFYAAILFTITAILASSHFLFRMYYLCEMYKISTNLTPFSVSAGLWHQVRTVLTEELLCRGVLLYILIKKIGQVKGIINSSTVFAALHWLNSGVWGNTAQMIIVFVSTFSMGLLLAFAFAKTFSLLIPFAIHLGWNVVQNYLFANSLDSNTVFLLAAPTPITTVSYMVLFILLFVPKMLTLAVNYIMVRRLR